jgi:tRNA pseudouridine synthase 10
VKELITGDEGRTTPSVAALLGTPCRCVELDVLDVAGPADDPPATS